MNARQKAKRYKKLYEESRMPYKTVYITSDSLERYSITSRLDDLEIKTMDEHNISIENSKIIELLSYRIAWQLERELPKFIELYNTGHETRARFDFWVRRKNERLC